MQCYSYTGKWWSGETTTKLMFSVKTQDSRGKSVQLYRFICEMYLIVSKPAIDLYSNATQHSKYPSSNTAWCNVYILSSSEVKKNLFNFSLC